MNNSSEKNGIGIEAFIIATILGYLALNLSAVLLSMFGALQGVAWTILLLVIALATGVFCRRTGLMQRDPPMTLPWPEVLILAALSFFVFVNQLIRPVSKFDDLMYHGSRAGYWMTNHSVFPFPVHNDRVVAFPVGGDLWFAFGVMVSHGEALGKLLVFLAYPLTLFLLLAILRLLKVRRWLSIVSMLGFAVIPLVRSAAVGLKPDLWAVFFSLTAIYWFIRAGNDVSENKKRCWIWMTVSIGCALGVKWTVIPLVVLIPLGLGKAFWKPSVFLKIGILFVGVLLIAGAGPALVHNISEHGHPLGAKAFREMHQRDKGLHTALVHFRRIPFLLFDFPMLPDEDSRKYVEQKLLQSATALGAMEVLPGENPCRAPGLFKPSVLLIGNRFSFLWFFLLLGLIALRSSWGTLRARKELFTVSAVAGMGVILFLAVVMENRWQPNAQLPERFLFPAIAFGFVVFGWVFDRAQRTPGGNPIVITVLVCSVLFHAIPSALATERILDTAARTHWQSPVNYRTDSEMEEAAKLIGSDRCILLFASEGALDYPLFDAQHGFTNRVYPWGKSEFDAARLQKMIKGYGIDTVVFEQSSLVPMLWDPDFDPAPFLRIMESLPDFQKISTQTPNVVFFRQPRALP